MRRRGPARPTIAGDCIRPANLATDIWASIRSIDCDRRTGAYRWWWPMSTACRCSSMLVRSWHSLAVVSATDRNSPCSGRAIRRAAVADADDRHNGWPLSDGDRSAMGFGSVGFVAQNGLGPCSVDRDRLG